MERDARKYLQTLVGNTVWTLTGKPNRILRLENGQVLVGTDRSPAGEWVSIDEVQRALDLLLRIGEAEITVESVGFRSAFVGAVLASIPEVVSLTRPPRIRIAPPLRPLVDRALAEVTNPRPLQFNGDHPFAQLFSEELRSAVEGIVADRSYLVKGSVGQGRWAETPWVAVFDRIVTDSAQRGYYVVYLFRRDGSGVYLSLNQGTTAVLAQARGQYRQVLADRARTYAGLLGAGRLEGLTLGTIDLGGGSTALTPGYEAGNIAARFYPKGQLPEEQTLVSHLRAILGLYADLISALDSVEELDQTTPETQPETAQEARRLRWHLRAEGRNSLAAKRAKQLLGYRCQVCGFDFEARYGELGQRYIEAHHLTPFADLGDRPTTLDPSRDFAVVCSNCHRMIHRQIPPLNVEDLRGRLRTRGS